MKAYKLVFLLALFLTACKSGPSFPPAKETKELAGIVNISVWYAIPERVDIPADCVIPMMSEYYVLDFTFDGYEQGWRVVRNDQCAGFAMFRNLAK